MQAEMPVVAENVSVLKRSGIAGSARPSIAPLLNASRGHFPIGFSPESVTGERDGETVPVQASHRCRNWPPSGTRDRYDGNRWSRWTVCAWGATGQPERALCCRVETSWPVGRPVSASVGGASAPGMERSRPTKPGDGFDGRRFYQSPMPLRSRRAQSPQWVESSGDKRHRRQSARNLSPARRSYTVPGSPPLIRNCTSTDPMFFSCDTSICVSA